MDEDRKEAARYRSFHVRSARPDDVEGISACLSMAFARHRDQYTAGGYADTVLDSDAVRRRMKGMHLFVAVVGRLVIGTVGCQVNGTEGHLRGMAVLPEWEGARVGSSLLNAAETQLRNSRCRLITLDTTEPLVRATEFYKRHGYSPSGKIADFFGMRLFEYRKVLL